MAWFRNYYECYRCDASWEDEWSSIVDDECGDCGARHVAAADTNDLTFVVEEEPHCFVVLTSPDWAEDDPEYQEVVRFLRRDFAEAYARVASARFVA
jgi:hypothetical protein